MQRIWIAGGVLWVAMVSGAQACTPCGCNRPNLVTPPESEPELLTRLRASGRSEAARADAATRLGLLAEPSQESVDAVVAALDAWSAVLRAGAAHGVYHLGPRARAGLPGLVGVLLFDKGEGPWVARSAIMQVEVDYRHHTLGWAVAWAYRYRAAALGLALLAWVAGGAALLRRWRWRTIWALVVGPAFTASGWALHDVLERAPHLLPETYLGVVPFPVTAWLSLSAGTAVLAAWLWLQSGPAASERPDRATPALAHLP